MRWILFCAFAIQAASCGQKGPLTLPESFSVLRSSIPHIELLKAEHNRSYHCAPFVQRLYR